MWEMNNEFWNVHRFYEIFKSFNGRLSGHFRWTIEIKLCSIRSLKQARITYRKIARIERVIGHLYSAWLLCDEPITRDAQIWPMIAPGSHSFTCHPLTNQTCLYSPAARLLSVQVTLTRRLWGTRRLS